ncbi:MAG: helix-turn-helix domain-containing protein [Richelia sp. RM2_1_2]|nr:helix-turn-helix domain-containing protein [Richelia sp. SM2_1_7]NJM18359.1 helix-turn-helix domain-containing protein [Richelia sp. SM1_7_0]NJO27163.1 helix-turn-helix domain-containing protein [Richelia sp. SL_2_1]NJO59420.1 helix-turn-helix domain-containing protein [Richelia sp. RM2_1_2]
MLIRDIRQELGLSQEEFASVIGVTFSTVNRCENGRTKPSRLASKNIEEKLLELGSHGKELLTKYLSD